MNKLIPLLLLIPLQLLADESVTLACDRNQETDVIAYSIYYGRESRGYTQTTNIGNTTTATISGLKEGATYYFAFTALNWAGKESGFSNEVTNMVPQAVIPPTHARIKTGLEWSPTPTGPWSELETNAWYFGLDLSNGFYRVKGSIEPMNPVEK